MLKPNTSKKRPVVDTETLTRALIERIDKDGKLSIDVTLRLDPHTLIPLMQRAAETNQSIGDLVSEYTEGDPHNPAGITDPTIWESKSELREAVTTVRN